MKGLGCRRRKIAIVTTAARCAKGFVVLPERWAAERTFARLGRCRRLAEDRECFDPKALAVLRLTSIRLMLRFRIAGVVRGARLQQDLAYRMENVFATLSTVTPSAGDSIVERSGTPYDSAVSIFCSLEPGTGVVTATDL